MSDNLGIEIVGYKPSTATTTGCATATYLLGQNFTVYTINVEFAGRTESIDKRYSDFAALDKQLRDLQLISRDSNLSLPSKSLFGKIGKKSTLEQRQQELGTFLQQLLREESSTCRHLLYDFLSIGRDGTSPMASGSTISAANTSGANSQSKITVPDVTNAVKGANNTNVNKVENLKEALVEGIMIRKHCRKSKPKNRLLFVNEDFSNLCWSQQKQWKPTLSFISIADIIEVRNGNEEDPRYAEHVGTAVLRKNSTPESITRSFSLITANRTLDIEAPDADTYELLYNGFKELIESKVKLSNSPLLEKRFNAEPMQQQQVLIAA